MDLFEMAAEYLTRDCSDGREDPFGMQHFLSLMYISDNDQVKYLVNVINILRGEEMLVQRPAPYTTIRVNNTKMKRIKIYRSLKHLDLRFTSCASNNTVLMRLHEILLEYIHCGGSEAYEIAKALQHIYKGCSFNNRKQDLMEIIRTMVYSPYYEVATEAEKLLRMVVNWYADDEKYEEVLKHITAKDWDKHHYLTFSLFLQRNHDVRAQLEFLTVKVIEGFSSNFTSHAASLMFSALVNQTGFDMFSRYVHPLLHVKLLKEDSRTFNSSTMNYLIPICVRQYGARLIFLTRNLSLKFKLKLFVHMCTKRVTIDKPIRCIDDALRSGSKRLMTLGFHILCSYGNVNVIVNETDLNLFKQYLTSFKTYDKSYVGNYERFLSQICLNAQDVDAADYITFFSWMYEFCMNNITARNNVQLACVLFSSTIKISVGSSMRLKVNYDVPSSKRYNEACNPIFCVLNELRLFRFLTNASAIILITQFMDIIEDTGPISELIIEHFMRYLTPLNVQQIVDQQKLLFKTPNISAAQKAQRITLMLLHFTDEPYRSQLVVPIFQELQHQYETVHAGNIYTLMHSNPLFVCMDCIEVLFDASYIGDDYVTPIFKLCNAIVMNCIRDIAANISGQEKIIKAAEYALSGAISLMYKIAEKANFPMQLVITVLETFTFIIQESNLKKPVSFAGKKIQNIVKLAPHLEQLYKQSYLDQQKHYDMNSVRRGRLRNHVQTNLVMHLLLKGINDWGFIYKALDHLMLIDKSSEIVLEASLGLLISLVSDPHFKEKLAERTNEIMHFALTSLNSSSRNNGMRLFLALSRRLLGMRGGNDKSQLSAVEFFKLNPAMQDLMESFLYAPSQSKEIKTAILNFIGETEYFDRLYSSKSYFNSRKLLELIQTSRRAVDAYVASCNFADLYNFILKDIEFFMNNKIDRNCKDCAIYLIKQQYKRLVRHDLDKRLQLELNTRIVQLFQKLLLDTALSNAIMENPQSGLSITESLNGLMHSPSGLYKQICARYLMKSIKNEALPMCLGYICSYNFSEEVITTCLGEIVKRMIYMDRNTLENLFVASVNELTRSINPSVEVIRLFYNLIVASLEAGFELSSCVDRFDKGDANLAQKHMRIQYIWLVIYGHKLILTEDEINDERMILRNMIDIAENGSDNDCYTISRMLTHVSLWMLPTASKCDILHLLMILPFKVERDDGLIQCFGQINGIETTLKGHLQWLNNLDVFVYITGSMPHVANLIIRTSKYLAIQKANMHHVGFFTNFSKLREKFDVFCFICVMMFEICQNILSTKGLEQ